MAHDIKSPGVSVQVIDQTSFAAVTQGTVSAAVGFAEKGPIDEPTLILSKEEFTNTFGGPIADNYYFGMFADKFMDVSVGYFTRIAKAADYESVVGTVAPGLDFSGLTTPVFWVELAGFPEPNNGIYRATIAASTYADLDALITAINTGMGSTTLADGSTSLDDYLTAAADSTDTFVEIKSDLYRNVVITIRADQGADNIAKTSGAGHLGIAANAGSSDVGNYAYAYYRLGAGTVVDATAGSITGASAMTTSDLNQLTAFNKIDVKVDGDGTNPYKTYTDIDVTPTTGAPATFPILQAAANPVAHDWVAETFDITLAGFYDFVTGDVSGGVNTTHTVTLTFDNDPVDLTNFINAINTALGTISTGTGNLDDYIQFAVYNTTAVQITNGTGGTSNFGSQCSVTVADGTGAIADIGYTTTTNDSATGGDTTYTAEGVAAKINAAVAEAQITSAADIITMASSRTGTTSYIEIEDATTAAESALGTGRPFDGIFTDGDSDSGENATNQGTINFVCKDAGTWGDNIKTRTYTTVNPVTAATQYYIEVYLGDDSVELWGPVDWTDDTATNFVATMLEDSNYIRVDFGETLQYPNTDTGTAPTAPPPNNADMGMPEYWQLAGGDDGIPTVSTESDALAVTALDEFNNKEQYEIDIILAPGFSGSSVVAKLQSVGEARADVIALVDPPAFLSYTDIIDWHNGAYGVSPNLSTSLSSSFVALLWDWQRDFDATNEQYVDLPPSIYEAVAMARTQSGWELWEAPAGPERGVVGSISSYSKPTAAQREFLYNDTDPANVNPVVQFPTEGIQIYGQKTCLRLNKSTNRINVRRLVNHVKRNVEKIGRRYVFKLNEASTWASIAREITSFLSNIQERGGLNSFSVVFDATTNTSDRIDAGIMYGKIFIQPTRVAERIFIDITIQRTGALAGEA